MQGDFREMQGGAKRKLAKRQRISTAWEASPYSKEQGGSREGQSRRKVHYPKEDD
jgi:hypothetical protein